MESTEDDPYVPPSKYYTVTLQNIAEQDADTRRPANWDKRIHCPKCGEARVQAVLKRMRNDAGQHYAWVSKGLYNLWDGLR